MAPSVIPDLAKHSSPIANICEDNSEFIWTDLFLLLSTLLAQNQYGLYAMLPYLVLERKFTPSQRNYATHEQELLAIIEAFMTWNDKLIGRPFTVVTDHRSLEFFMTQGKLSPRQNRWYEYLSRFNYKPLYVQGKRNTVADLFSRFYQFDSPSVHVDEYEYVQADRRLDPEGDWLPRFIHSSHDSTPYFGRTSIRLGYTES